MENRHFLNLTDSDYKSAYNRLQEFCQENVGLIQFGEFGDASFPGISDLDVFICLADNNFSGDQQKILSFITKDETLLYLFFHDPLIIPYSLLPHLRKFHTCYNLSLSVSEVEDIVQPVHTEYLTFLNDIWTTFLISLGPSLLMNEGFGARDYLLAHKNVCQSIYNLDGASDSLTVSRNVRDEYVKGNKSREWVRSIFRRELDTLYKITSDLLTDYDGLNTKGTSSISTATIKHFHLGTENSYRFGNGIVNIHLTDALFSFLGHCYRGKSDNDLVSQYLSDCVMAYKICKRLGTDFPFISPFAYNFFRDDAKFILKRHVMTAKNWIQTKKSRR